MPKNGKSNAFKHGAYAHTHLVLLSFEDRERFAKHSQRLFEEFRPDGALEEEIVGEIARLLWHKHRMERMFMDEMELTSSYHSRDYREIRRSEHARLSRSCRCWLPQMPLTLRQGGNAYGTQLRGTGSASRVGAGDYVKIYGAFGALRIHYRPSGKGVVSAQGIQGNYGVALPPTNRRLTPITAAVGPRRI